MSRKDKQKADEIAARLRRWIKEMEQGLILNGENVAPRSRAALLDSLKVAELSAKNLIVWRYRE